MKYTEEDLRKAFQAGILRGGFLEANEYAPFSTPLDEDEYIAIVKLLNKSVIEEDKISFTYSFLRRKIDWEQFCDLTGIDYYAKANGYEVKDNEVFYVAESKAKQLNLI